MQMELSNFIEKKVMLWELKDLFIRSPNLKEEEKMMIWFYEKMSFWCTEENKN